MTTSQPAITPGTRPLAGLRVVEVSSFIASPLCGLTLAQLGAEVIRVDPPNGAADYTRLPLSSAGRSIYWTGLNKGKQSYTCDMRTEEGQRSVRQLVTGGGESGGILLTNMAGREWLSHQTLAKERSDIITVQILGRSDGSTGVDYTVNAATGFPFVTGPTEYAGVVNHSLPAWDVACGLFAATSVLAAVRRREQTGAGAEVVVPLDDVALSIASTLGYLTETQVNGSGRERTGNYVYGTYGTDFETKDGERFMLVALTSRHFRDLVSLTDTQLTIDAVEKTLNTDFSIESARYEHREVLTALFVPWFAARSSDVVASALRGTSILHERYRSFQELTDSGELARNPLFAELDQPGIGSYLAAALPARFDGEHYFVDAAPNLNSYRP